MTYRYAIAIIGTLLLTACKQDQLGEKAIYDDLDEAVTSNSVNADVEIPFEKFTLDNGLRVIVHEDRKAPIVAVSIWYHVGSKDEPQGKTGFAHLFEHLMFNGSENYDGEFFEPLEKVGATTLNGTTWFDRTNYFENVPTTALETALWLESDRMGHLLGAVTQEKLDEQRGVVQNEKREGDNQPFGTVEYRQLEGLFPPGHPYRHSTIGSMADLDAASLEDVHSWFKEYYGAANTVLVLAGDINAAQARPLVEKYFGHINPGPPLRHHKSWVPVKASDVVEVMVDRVPHTRISYSWAVPSRTDRAAYELDLAASVLGGGKNSRLYRTLVYDEQLASDVTAVVQRFELASVFEIQVDMLPGKDTTVAERFIQSVLAEFLENGPRESELERVRGGKVSAVIKGLEQVGGFGGKATALARGELYAGDPAFYRQQLDWMASASIADVQRTAQTWLQKGAYRLTIVPFADYRSGEDQADRSRLPQVSEFPDLAFPAAEQTKLSNGMDLVVVTRDAVPVVRVAMQFDAGYAADAGSLLGRSSFALAMLDEGTANLSALEISEKLESLGATLSTGSNLDMSSVTLSALRSNFADALGLMSDVVRTPSFPQEEIDRLRGRWLAGIQSEMAQPIQLAFRTLPPILYGEGHAYAIPLTGSGTPEAINNLTRDDLMAFHRQWIRPDNATLFVVGDIALAEAAQMFEKAFGDWKAPNETVPEKTISHVDLPNEGRVLILDRPGAPQTLILGGHLIDPTGAVDALQFDAANEILGGAFTARVNMNLREDKGWSYGAFTFNTDARGQRMWLAYAPVQADRAGDAITELRREVTAFMGSSPPTSEELSKVIANDTNSLPGQFETSAAVMGSLLSSKRFGRPFDYPTKLKGLYQKLDIGEITDIAYRTIKFDRVTWLLVGDKDQILEQISDLDLGAIEVRSDRE